MVRSDRFVLNHNMLDATPRSKRGERVDQICFRCDTYYSLFTSPAARRAAEPAVRVSTAVLLRYDAKFLYRKLQQTVRF